MNTLLAGANCNILDLIPMLALERMDSYALEQFARECHVRAQNQPDNDRGCWVTEIYLELADQALRLRDQRNARN